MKKIIIFDLDGTIANSFDILVEILNDIAKQFNLELSKNEITQLIRNENLKDIIKKFKINKIKLFFLLLKIKKKMRDKIININSVPEIKEMIKKLDNKYTLILLTSNNKKNTEAFLKKENLNYFSKKYFSSGLFNKNKMILKIIKENKYNLNEILYIGDEVRDIQSCKLANIDIVAVTWGFNSKELLQKYSPNYLIKKPSEIIDCL